MHATAKIYTAATIHFLMQYSVSIDVTIIILFQHDIYSHQTKVIVYTVHEEYKIKDTSSAVEYSNV